MQNFIEENAQKTLDRFFEKGAVVKKEDWDFLLTTFQAHESHLKEEIRAEIIVDLYECRASCLVPLQARQMEKVENLFQYNFLNSIIAKLSDKYKIKYETIKDVIRKRSLEDNLLK